MKKLWTDPVFSQIIAAFILLLISGIFSAFRDNSNGGLHSILDLDVPLWVFITVFILYLVILQYIDKFRKPAFLNYTSANIGGYDWHWCWTYDQQTKKYSIDQVSPICKDCGKDLFLELYASGYQCINGHIVYSQSIKFTLSIKEIERTIMDKYPKDSIKYFTANH